MGTQYKDKLRAVIDPRGNLGKQFGEMIREINASRPDLRKLLDSIELGMYNPNEAEKDSRVYVLSCGIIPEQKMMPVSWEWR